MNIFLYIMIFMMGAVFGSFFTLAVYRIPKGQDIVHTHSYCPNCGSKLGVLELIPILSYIGLRGKCAHCGQKIRIRYLLLEILSGIVFLLFALSLKADVYNLDTDLIIYFSFFAIYFASLFIIAGIDKEKIQIQKALLVFGFIWSFVYMIYVCIQNFTTIYTYIIYLIFMILLLIADTVYLKKKLKQSYALEVLMLILYMFIFSGSFITILTILYTVFCIVIEFILLSIKEWVKRKSILKIRKDGIKVPIGFYLCIFNIMLIIVFNFLGNWVIQ